MSVHQQLWQHADLARSSADMHSQIAWLNVENSIVMQLGPGVYRSNIPQLFTHYSPNYEFKIPFQAEYN
jgi:glucuronate isomerase